MKTNEIKQLYTLIIVSMTLILVTLPIIKSEEEHEYLSYTNQLTWGGECAERAGQSPININTSPAYLNEDGDLKVKSLNYSILKNVQRAISNGHSFVFKYDNIVDNYILMEKFEEEYKFTLSNVHIHCPAEHMIDSNIEYNCEIHLVHQRVVMGGDEDKVYSYLVVGILVKEGSADNALFAGTDMDYSPIITTDVDYFYYEGSLTTPPCSEQVNWLVRRDPINASKAQISSLKSWIDSVYPDVGNDRVVQTTGDRKIYLIKGSFSCALQWSWVVMLILAILF